MIMKLTGAVDGDALYLNARCIDTVCEPSEDGKKQGAKASVWQGNDDAAQLMVAETVEEVVFLWRHALDAKIWSVDDLEGRR